MKCRVCGKEISFVKVGGKQSAVHTEVGGAGLEPINPSPGHQRKLRQQLERECRQSLSGAPENTASTAAEPVLVDDVKSVQDAADEGKEEFQTFNA